MRATREYPDIWGQKRENAMVYMLNRSQMDKRGSKRPIEKDKIVIK